MTAELQRFLRTRRSIRRFKQDPVSTTLIEQLLETATYAPSAHNNQPWRFVVVSSHQAREALSKAVTDKFKEDMSLADAPNEVIQQRVERTIQRIAVAPVIVIICRDVTQVDPQPNTAAQEAEVLMGRQSVAAAGMQLLLAAHAEGLAGTWICWPIFAPAEIISALGLPSEWEPQGMVFLGHPAEEPATPERPHIKEITRFL